MAQRGSARGAAAGQEPLAMARSARKGSRALSVPTLLLALLLPGVASAGWGNENWGEMVWRGGAIPVPSMSVEGLIALAIFLLVVPGMLLARRRRGARP